MSIASIARATPPVQPAPARAPLYPDNPDGPVRVDKATGIIDALLAAAAVAKKALSTEE